MAGYDPSHLSGQLNNYRCTKIGEYAWLYGMAVPQ